MSNPWEILKEAQTGSVNFENGFKSQKAERQKSIAIAKSLVREGLLEPMGNSNVYYLTAKGLIAVNYDNLEAYYEAQNSDPNLKAISDAVDTIKDIYRGNYRTQKLVKWVSIITAIAIVSQAFIAFKQYKQQKSQQELLPPLNIDSLIHIQQYQLNQMKTTLDSLKSEHNVQLMKKDSTYLDTVKVSKN